MYGILDRYIGKNVVFSVLLISVCLTLFAALINLIDVIRYIGRGDINFLFLIEYVGYKVPGIFATFFPVAILIGGVVGLGVMARNSEIVILQSSGLSRLNIGVSCVKSILPLIIVVMLLGETVVPSLDKKAEDEYDRKAGGVSGMTVNSNGTWVKEGNSFICITAIMPNSMLAGLYKYDYEGTELKKFSFATIAQWEDGKWIMRDVTSQVIEGDKVTPMYTFTEEWPMSLNVDRISVLNELTENLSIPKLWDYINYLEINGVDSSRYRLSLYNKLMQPLVMLVMLLLALSTIFGPLRSMNMSARILSGIALGFGYYVLNQIVAPFSLVYGVTPIIGASFATIVFAGLAVYLLRRKA